MWTCRFNSWVRKIPWKRAWQPTLVFLPGKSHGQRSLEGYTVSGVVKGWDMTERLSNNNDKMFYVLFEIVYTLWLVDMSVAEGYCLKFLLENSCFTMLYYFLWYSKMNQLYVYMYIYPLFFAFPPHLGHHRALSTILSMFSSYLSCT